jgi:hypothetical protein
MLHIKLMTMWFANRKHPSLFTFTNPYRIIYNAVLVLAHHTRVRIPILLPNTMVSALMGAAAREETTIPNPQKGLD